MRKIRIFHNHTVSDDFILLEEENVHYLVDVLRLRGGEVIEVLTVDRQILEGKLFRDRKNYYIRGLKEVDHQSRSLPEINLFIGVIKWIPFEYAVEKASELGANSITPIYCDYSSIREISDRKIERFKKIARSSMLQSGRERSILINPPCRLEEALLRLMGGNNFYAHPYSDLYLDEIFGDKVDLSQSFNIFSGPEGGFSDSEIELFERSGVKGISFYSNILRAETIPLVICSIILYEYHKSRRSE